MGSLLFIIYINNIHRSYNLGKFILFADDTNIFVADKCKNTVYETANKVLEFVYRYMKCNILHINFKKCCYMHLTPNRNDKVPNDGTLLLTLNVVCKIPLLARRTRHMQPLGQARARR